MPAGRFGIKPVPRKRTSRKAAISLRLAVRCLSLSLAESLANTVFDVPEA